MYALPAAGSKVWFMDIDWEDLTERAHQASLLAYAPYSKYPVGAAVLLDDGQVVTGANIENASYGLTLCAECSVISQVGTLRPTAIRAVVCVNIHREPIAPCGRCRQILTEFAAPLCEVLVGSRLWRLTELLPASFGPTDLRFER